MSGASTQLSSEGSNGKPPLPIGYQPNICNNPFRWRRTVASPWHNLPPTVRWVLTCLSYFGDKAGKNIFPSQARLAKRAALHPRTVRRALKTGLQEGWISRRPRGQGFYYSLMLPHKIGLLETFEPEFHERVPTDGHWHKLS